MRLCSVCKCWHTDNFLQVTLCLGNHALVLQRGLLQCAPYLYLMTDNRWANDKLTFSLPHTTEFQEDITLLFELIKFSVEPKHYKLPSYQRLFQLVRLADYIGCDQFLEMVASRLGVAVPMISNANPIRNVRGLIRSRYRAHSKFVQDIWSKGNKCAKCGWMLVRGTTALQRPQLSTTPCCGADEHMGCNVRDMCRHCNTNLKVLPCVVCDNEIAPPDATVDDAYRLAVRTPCCLADCHKACRDQLFQRRQCVLCHVALTADGKTNDDLMDAPEYIFMRRERTLNDIRRRKNLPYTVVPVYESS